MCSERSAGRSTAEFIARLMLVGCVLVAGRAVHAQAAGPTAPTAAAGAGAETPALQEARAHFDRGLALFEHRDFDAALAEFLRAYDLSHRPNLLYNIGSTYQQLHRYTEAIDTLQRFVAEGGAANPRLRADAERALHEIETLLARVTVTTDPAGATLTLDGRAIEAGAVVRVGAGRHHIEAQLDGYRVAHEEVVIASGESRSVTVQLRRLTAGPGTGDAPAVVAPTRLVVTGVVPEALVHFGGAQHPVTDPIEAPAGRYDVRVTAPDTQPWSGSVELIEHTTRTLRVSLAPLRSGLLAPGVFWTLAIGSTVIASVAIGTGIAAITTNAAFHSPFTNDADAPQLEARGRALALAADVMGLTSVVGGLVSLVLSTRTDFNPRRSTAVLLGGVPGGFAAGWWVRF